MHSRFTVERLVVANGTDVKQIVSLRSERASIWTLLASCSIDVGRDGRAQKL